MSTLSWRFGELLSNVVQYLVTKTNMILLLPFNYLLYTTLMLEKLFFINQMQLTACAQDSFNQKNQSVSAGALRLIFVSTAFVEPT